MAYGMRCTRIQLGGRLINQQHARLGAYRTREHKTLRLASRQIAETPVRRIRQIEQFHRFQSLRFRFAAAHSLGEQWKHHMVERRALRNTIRILKHPSNTIHTFSRHRASVRLLPSCKNRQQC